MYEKMEKKLQKIFGKNIHMASVRFFESKKNQVALIEFDNCRGTTCGAPTGKIIMKTFIWGERKKEEEILKKLHELGVPVSKIIKSEKDILFLEYIPGENLRTLYNKEKNLYTKKARKYDGLIARWLGNFHKVFKNNTVGACHGMPLLKGDMHIQNFILSGDILFGVDFEEASTGAPEYDLAQLFAVFLTQIIKINEKTTTVGARHVVPLIAKHKKRVDDFIKIYSKTSGISVNKNIDKLIKQELVKISTYMPHLKDNILSLLVAAGL